MHLLATITIPMLALSGHAVWIIVLRGVHRGIAIYDLYIEPDKIFGGSFYKTDATIFAVDDRTKTNWFSPRRLVGSGFTLDAICKLAISTNGGSDWFGPGSYFEVYDCGPA